MIAVLLRVAVVVHVLAVAALLVAVAMAAVWQLLAALAGLVVASVVWIVAVRSYQREEDAWRGASVIPLPQREAA